MLLLWLLNIDDTVRYDTTITIPPAWIFHRHCVYYSPLGPQCKMEYPGAPAAGFPEEMRRGVGGRWRGIPMIQIKDASSLGTFSCMKYMNLSIDGSLFPLKALLPTCFLLLLIFPFRMRSTTITCLFLKIFFNFFCLLIQ